MSRPHPGCPSEEALAAFVERRLSPLAAAGIDVHLDRCATCRRIVATVALLQSGSQRPRPRAR